MNSAPVRLQVSGRAPDEKTTQDWLQRTAHPVLQALRELTNGLAQNTVQTVTTTTQLDPRTDVVLADASAGPITVTPPTAALWERRIIVIKTDASVNAVTVVGINTATLTTQYAGAEMVCDGGTFYAVEFGGVPSLGPDVTGAPDNNTVVAFQHRAFASTAPAKYQLIRSPDGATWAPSYEGFPAASGLLTYSLTAGNVDLLVFTVPASPTGSGRFVIQRAYARVNAAIVGTGTVAVRVGTSAGDNSIGSDQTASSATTAGTIFSGLAIASRGSAVLVANSYEASLAAGATIYARAATTGTISAGSCDIYIYGAFLP